MVKYLSSFIDKYQHALSAGKTTAHSSELTPNVSLFPELNSDTKLPSTWTFNGKIILVTEEHCVSSCLDFVEFVKAIPGVVHVGQTTDADTAYTTIAGMRETSFKENVFYMVPIVKHLDRRRQNNIPYTPDIAYEGDINDTAALEKRILEIAKSH